MSWILLMGLVYHYIYKVCHSARNTVESQLILAVLRGFWKKKDANEKIQNCLWSGRKVVVLFPNKALWNEMFLFWVTGIMEVAF